MSTQPDSVNTTTLLAYGLPGLPLAVLGLPLYVFLPAFYAQAFGIGLATVGAVLLVARLFDVITDPLVGHLSDHTRSRFGRRKIWMLAGAPLLLIGVTFLFLPAGSPGTAYLLVFSLITYLGWTLVALPYTAWGAELSPDYHQRSRIAASREGFVIAGTLLAAAAPVLLGHGEDTGATLASLALWLWILIPASLLLLLWRVREPERVRAPVAWSEGWRILLDNAPFKRLLLAYLLNGTANALPATLFLLFVGHVLGAPEMAGLLLLLYFAAGVLSLPLWLRLARVTSKHRTWSLSMLWACAVFLWVPFLSEGQVWAFAVICLLSGLSLGVDLALPSAIQADVVDLDTANGGGERAGVFFGLWGMATKLALALAVGIAFPLLQLAGFDAGAENSASALMWLALLYAGLPVLLKLAATALVWRFPIDAGAHARLRDHLDTATESHHEPIPSPSSPAAVPVGPVQRVRQHEA
ncbi:major facilitator superfamily transport protein [Thioalkalivibrio sulfidiphilus HL-EbGr7]|uniref:Major facilitator superfamily transport protein n=1 Tax=Thioalkalivibrio sulfidiphilus (strain HL-EbGR7) TaxID=396588 RepID=B8GR52_THISH|nr:MFS transporter [Thioalkalivibrio sulfidiphilus]ACL72472.1 major facilitator superfamily transport protein [Thioalkalivibrio sulfidiphilus HL-EbGr7]